MQDVEDDPLHLQQLHKLAALLQQSKEQSDSVTWVPELIPQFVQQAVEAALAPAASQSAGEAGEDAAPLLSPSGSNPSDDTAAAAAAPTAPAAALVAVGSQHLQVIIISSSKRPVHWVMTTCLVPDGVPTAAAAEGAGGLAAMEVVCRLVTLRDCQPAEASAAFAKALSKVRWQQFGLQFSDFFSCDDTTGVLTLGVLPDAVMVPLSLIVCCCNVIEAPQGMMDDAPDAEDPYSTAAAGADQDPADPTQTQTQPASTAQRSNKRRRGGSRGPPKPPALSMRREVPLWAGAVEGALSSLKAQLPAGYLRGRHETLLAAALPPIAASLANIMLRAANVQLRQDSCSLLDCSAAELQDTLLAQLQELAAEGLAQKAAGPQQQQHGRSTQQTQVDVSAAAAALLEARWQDEGAHGSQGHEQGRAHRAPADGEDQQHQSQHQGQQQQQQQQPKPLHHHDHYDSGWPSAGAGLQGSGLQGAAAQWGATGLERPGTGFVGSLPAPHNSSRQQPMPGWGADAAWDQEGLQQQQHWQEQQQAHEEQPLSHSAWDTSGRRGAVSEQDPGFVHPPLLPLQQQQKEEEEEEGCDWGYQSGASAGQQVPWQAQGRQQRPQGGWGLLGPASTEQWYGPDVMSGPSPTAPDGLARNSAQHAGAPSISASGFASGAGTHGWSGLAAGWAGAGAAGVELPASRRRVSGSAAAGLF